MKKIMVGMFGAAFVSMAIGSAQSSRPTFEVGTIKPSDPGQRGATIQNFVGGRFVARAVPLRPLMTYAYGVRNFQILGGPAWMGTDRWDIEAKAEEGSIPTGRSDPTGSNAMAIRLQSLLEDRFQLKIHRETRELPIYELTIAKSGLKMKLSDDQTPFRLPEPGTAPPPPQRGGGIGRYQLRLGRGSVEALAVEMTSFVQALSQQVGRTIVDKTGLKGLHDIKLEWTPDTPVVGGPAGPNPEAAPPPDPNGPSMFTAIQEQLGLKLESARGPVEVLVIDHVERPSEN